MAELEEGHPLLNRGLNVLLHHLRGLVERGGVLTHDELKALAKDHRDAFKRDTGYDFPHLSPFYLPSVRFAAFYRSDRDERTAGQQVLMLLRDLQAKGFSVSAVEVTAAANQCWPHIRYLAIEDMRRDTKVSKQLQ